MSWADVAGYVILGLLAVIIIGYLYYLGVATEDPAIVGTGKSICENMGCPKNTTLIGSISLNKYYSCDCKYAKLINNKNVKCLASQSEAESVGFRKAKCSFWQTIPLSFS